MNLSEAREAPPPGNLRYAVVLGSDINALGVVRSLALGRVPTIVVGPRAGAAMASRFPAARIVLEDTGSSPALANALRSACGARQGESGMLFATEEKSVAALAVDPGCVPSAMFRRTCPADTLLPLTRKDAFQRIAQAGSFPVPGAAVIRGDADLPALHALRYPCVFKPNYRNYAYGARFKKAYKVANADEAIALYREIAPTMPEMIAQEWIEGEDSEIYFCLQYVGEGGRTVASFTGRKLRSWPPRIGGTASCAPASAHAEALSELTARFFAHAGFRGMGSMEYKRDSRDGNFYMVEPTVGRTDFQEEVATVNGVNLPLAAFLYESGRVPQIVAQRRPPTLWRDTDAERRSRRALPTDVSAIAAGLNVADALWRVTDPGPALSTLVQRLRARLP